MAEEAELGRSTLPVSLPLGNSRLTRNRHRLCTRPANAGDPSPRYKNHVATKPTLALKIATTVTHPRIFRGVEFTLSPMMARLLVINMISNSSGGVEKPCT